MTERNAKNKGRKLAVPRSASEIQALEDRVDKIREDLKHVRQGLTEGPLYEVVLKLGTFEHFLDKIEDLAGAYRATFDAEKRIAEGKQKRGQIEEKRQANQKNHK